VKIGNLKWIGPDRISCKKKRAKADSLTKLCSSIGKRRGFCHQGEVESHKKDGSDEKDIPTWEKQKIGREKPPSCVR